MLICCIMVIAFCAYLIVSLFDDLSILAGTGYKQNTACVCWTVSAQYPSSGP